MFLYLTQYYNFLQTHSEYSEEGQEVPYIQLSEPEEMDQTSSPSGQFRQWNLFPKSESSESEKMEIGTPPGDASCSQGDHPPKPEMSSLPVPRVLRPRKGALQAKRELRIRKGRLPPKCVLSGSKSVPPPKCEPSAAQGAPPAEQEMRASNRAPPAKRARLEG